MFDSHPNPQSSLQPLLQNSSHPWLLGLNIVRLANSSLRKLPIHKFRLHSHNPNDLALVRLEILQCVQRTLFSWRYRDYFVVAFVIQITIIIKSFNRFNIKNAKWYDKLKTANKIILLRKRNYAHDIPERYRGPQPIRFQLIRYKYRVPTHDLTARQVRKAIKLDIFWIGAKLSTLPRTYRLLRQRPSILHASRYINFKSS